tara:strand:+ start:5379 stop:6371 length:993 start_codon:yes stop_codon:yes gene_type:complete
LADETNPINGNDLGAVAESLIMDTPTNPEPEAEEVAEVSEDTQTEAIEDAEVIEDAVEASDDSEIVSDDEEYEVAEEPTVQEEPLFTVKVNGEERQVNLEELTRGYSGQKYIQESMAENAKMRKEAETIAQQATQERQMLRQMMQQLQAGGMPPVPEYPAEELRNSDPLGYLEKEAEYRRAVDKRQQWEQQVKVLNQKQAEEEARKHNENLSHQAMRLAEWMPEFKDDAKRAVFIKDMTTKAKKHYKLTDEQMSVVETAEEIMILNDAVKWRELQASKSTASKKAEGARPVVKPAAKRAATAGKASKAAKAKTNMSKTGSIESVADYLLS